MIKHVNITITGKVQNVGFRFSALDKALELGLFGTVKNMDRDKIYIEVEGEVEQLKEFLRFCHQGPTGSRIQKVDYESTEELKNFTEFSTEF